MSDDDLILIRGRGSVSALGLGGNFVASSPVSAFSSRPTGTRVLPVASLPTEAEEAVAAFRHAHAPYRQLDRTVLLALLAARQATAQAGWAAQDASLGVSIGSSRGATGRLEQFHIDFLADGVVAAAASPLTTLGNVASWVAYDAGAIGGAALSHSSTCSSAFQALGNAVAWLRAGLADRFLAGGAEAPLTDFTLAQMHALGIYSTFAPQEWPCRPGAGAPSTFVLGEGAAVFALERVSRAALAAEPATALAPHFQLESVGFGFEAIPSKTGLSADGQHFQTAMRQALRQANCPPEAIDALVLHSPGTPAGDAAERRAVLAVFGAENAPQLVSNKWLVGHTLGASAALSLEFALQMLTHQTWPKLPFETYLSSPPNPNRPIRRVLVNAAGFGGNASSALVSLV